MIRRNHCLSVEFLCCEESWSIIWFFSVFGFLVIVFVFFLRIGCVLSYWDFNLLCSML